jgi:hypothetical protein
MDTKSPKLEVYWKNQGTVEVEVRRQLFSFKRKIVPSD